MTNMIRPLINILNDATKAYDAGTPTMTDKEWDNLYFQLENLEKNLGIIYPDSPTQKIHFETVSALNKVVHNHLMLSLSKTKDVNDIKKFVGDNDFIAMSKMDGLTCSLKYTNGKLVSAETRGNGTVGEDITHNAHVIKSIPQEILWNDELIVDGEIICTYNDFEPWSQAYQNPRNFAAGSVRLLDSKEAFGRSLTFVAWDAISPIAKTLKDKLDTLEGLGFTIVPYIPKCDIQDAIDWIKLESVDRRYPIDGVVFKFNDCDFYASLGNNAHDFIGGKAFKFYDEEYETVLKDIDWTMGRTGTLCPTAIFEPVDTGDSIIERASLHNVSVMLDTLNGHGYYNQAITVAKMNMIIPQVVSADADDEEAIHFDIPTVCPYCGEPVKIVETDNSLQLTCLNPECGGRLINRLDHFAGKKGLDIRGLSLATLEKLIDWGWVNNYKDIYHLKEHRVEWINKSGFGSASVGNILKTIEDSRNVSLENFIASLGIPLVGSRMAKVLVKHITSYKDFRNKVDCKFDFSTIDGFADAKTEAIWNFKYDDADAVYEELNIINPEPVEDEATQGIFTGKTFCITGSLKLHKNRDELVKWIEANGGKTTGSVSKNTSYLINNDSTSSSSKNLTAKKLGIPIITEEELEQVI